VADEVTCDVCGLELASVETRNLLHAGELVRYGEYRGKCIKDVSCIQRGYDNATKVALKLSVEVSEQKARADAATAKAEQYERDWYAAKSEFGTAMAKSREALAAARRECEGLRTALGVAAENLCLEGPDHDALDSPPCGDPICTGCVARAALAAPAAGEEGK
jgi:hypothetical protein